jgi:hypothetical protein
LAAAVVAAVPVMQAVLVGVVDFRQLPGVRVLPDRDFLEEQVLVVVQPSVLAAAAAEQVRPEVTALAVLEVKVVMVWIFRRCFPLL